MNEIFSHFISKSPADDMRKVGYIMWFSDVFPDSEFDGEDLVMKHYCNYSSRLNVPMKYSYFNTFLSTELRRLLIETGVRVPGTDNLNYSEPASLESAYLVAKEYLQNEFRILESYEIDVDDFVVAADAYMTQKLSQRVVEELGKTYETLSQGENSRETVDYALDKFILLKDIYDKELLEELVDKPRHVGGEFLFVCDTGIPVIDDDITALFTKQLFGIEAQPGTGKTRFTLGCWLYRAAVIYKKNVIYYQLEQSKTEAEAILVARHVFTLYNIQISDRMILTDDLPDDIRSKVAAAKIDLFESGKYGKIYLNRTDLYYETLVQTFKKDDKLHGPFDVIAIDYMGLIGQRPGKYSRERLQYEVIGGSFRKFKHYVEATMKSGIAVSQFNEKGIDAGKADKEITTNMAQGGIEVYRHTDQNLALSSTTVMKAQQKMRVSQPKIRGTSGFGSAVIDTRLAFSYFYQNAPQQI